jgi:hypothetical protein
MSQRRNGLICPPRPSLIFATQSGSPIRLRPTDTRSKSPRRTKRCIPVITNRFRSRSCPIRNGSSSGVMSGAMEKI